MTEQLTKLTVKCRIVGSIMFSSLVLSRLTLFAERGSSQLSRAAACWTSSVIVVLWYLSAETSANCDFAEVPWYRRQVEVAKNLFWEENWLWIEGRDDNRVRNRPDLLSLCLIEAIKENVVAWCSTWALLVDVRCGSSFERKRWITSSFSYPNLNPFQSPDMGKGLAKGFTHLFIGVLTDIISYCIFQLIISSIVWIMDHVLVGSQLEGKLEKDHWDGLDVNYIKETGL